MKIRINTHRPNPALWLVALVLFIYGIVGLPYGGIALILSAALLLLGTTVI